MHRSLATVVMCGACALLPACGDGTSPTAPATSTVTGLTVSVQAGGTLYIGSAAQLQAMQTMSDGTTRSAAAAWSSDSPAVATVSPTGVVTGVGAGEATIAADVSATRGTLRVRVYPNFNGTWHGTESAVSCDDSGAFEGACSDVDFYRQGQVYLHDSKYVQTDAAVTTTLDLGEGYTASGSAAITSTGELQLPSTRVQPEGAVTKADIDNLRFRSDTPGRLTGTYAIRFTAPGYDGSVLLGLRLEDVGRTSVTAAAHPGNTGRNGHVGGRITRVLRTLR